MYSLGVSGSSPNHNLGHPENTYILIPLIFYTGLDLNPTLLLY